MLQFCLAFGLITMTLVGAGGGGNRDEGGHKAYLKC